ncbi:MAG: cation-translocating P-type ATPase [Reyranellaceae bacterium]
MPASLGLTQADAAERLRRDGFNDLPSLERRRLPQIVLGVLREPMFALLLGAGILYLVLGEISDAAILLAFATVSVSISVVQEARSERVLEALRDMASPRALVIRDGERRRIAGREVVCGDAVILAEGDRVPADLVLVRASDLLIDESLLTGESVAVAKTAVELPGGDAPAGGSPGGDDTPFAFSGTLVVRGEGIGIATATGPRSALGRIGLALRGIESEPPHLQTETRRIVRVFAAAGGAAALLAVLLYGLVQGDWLRAVLGGIALGMSMLPEEFPLVLTAFMVMGAWRLSRARVLTRRASAIEMLGAATVLCTDKTGTLTENRMTVAALRTPQASWSAGAPPLDAELAELLRVAALASVPDSLEPMERAIQALAGAAGASRGSLAHRYGLRPELLAVTHVWRPADGAPVLEVAAKGAPEAIARLCRLAPADRQAMQAWLAEMSREGLRVLGVAAARHADGPLPETPDGFAFRFLGLVGFADPVRANVPAAIAECRSAGVRVVMITGDYPATARAIAARAGLAARPPVDGTEVAGLDDPALRRRVAEADIFARILPEQKLRLVEALKANGEIVAMTGDGVNDAPALKAAHIGVAMGGRGTDVAREASSIVLLDDDFGSIVQTLRLGRRIYDNLRKASGYILAIHVPIAGLALLPLLFGLPLLLLPVHIAFLEMVIDPACSIVFEAEEGEVDLMRRPPRSPDSRLLSRGLVAWGLLQGVLAVAALAVMLATAVARAMPEDELRALLFVSLVLINASLILVNRSFSASLWTALGRRNPVLWGLLALVAAVLALALTWPPAMALFRFGPLHGDDLGLAAACGLVVLALLEVAKPRFRSSLLG